MSLQFKKASRQGVKPLIDLYSESGCGKTFSALLLARGIVGPSGKIAMGDSESGRGSLYADVIPGGYDVIEMNAPFSPASYIGVIEAAEEGGYDILILDSMSHEWEGIGGVLDMAGDNEQRSGKSGLHNWKVPKLEHNKLVLKLLQTRLVIICCIRAKFKSRQIKENGKTVIVKDDVPSPIQSEEFIFEATAHALLLPDHTIRLTKCSHPALRECFPQDEKEPLSVKHGEAISRWCIEGTASAPQKPAKTPLETAKAALWKEAKPKFNNDPKKFEEWLLKEGHINFDETLESLTSEKLQTLVPIVQELEFQF